MISTEDRARAAMRAIADTVHDAPPLQLPLAQDLTRAADEVRLGGHGTRRLGLRRPGGAARPGSRGRDRRWRSWAAPVAAAVAVAAVAIALVIIRDVPNGRVAAPSTATASATPTATPVLTPAGVPEYYVAWMQAEQPYLLVGNTLTGKLGAPIKAPDNVDLEGVYGVADNDRTFIVTGTYVHAPFNASLLYLLRIDPGGGSPARLTPLPISLPADRDPAGVAVSPDGTELAVALPGSPATLQVYSIPTGKLLRTWSSTVPGEQITAEKVTQGSWQFTAMVLRWSLDGRQLAFAWNASAIRVLDAAAPDGNLITSSREIAAIGTTYAPEASFTCHAAQGWQLIAGGQGVICGGSEQEQLLQTSPSSTATGGACTDDQRILVGFLQATTDSQGGGEMGVTTSESECPSQVKPGDGAYIGWANADGSILIGSLVWDGHSRFGIFRGERFTPLPALPVSEPVPTGVLVGTYAW